MSRSRPIVPGVIGALAILPLSPASPGDDQAAPPAYLAAATDAASGTPFRRITDPGGPAHGALRCAKPVCTHRYASAQAWNADQSLLVIAHGCNGLCFLDGRSYAPLFARPTADPCEWHPRDPAVMICVRGSAVYTWAPRSNALVARFEIPDHRDLEFGPGKGNPSASGERLVLRGRDRNGAQVAFAYDLAARRLYPDIALERLPGRNDSCTISPSGTYVFCAQRVSDTCEPSYVFSVEGVEVQRWGEHHRPGHGDLATDADGEDVYVGISKAEPDRFHVIKRRLRDGLVVDLLPYSQATHASTRSLGRPGWVFLTFAGTAEAVASGPPGAPYHGEIVALRLDGSGEVRRIVRTRSAEADYWSEPHASPSPDGTRVVWSSNWGRAGGPVSDYVADVSW